MRRSQSLGGKEREEEAKLWKVNMPSSDVARLPSPAIKCVCTSLRCTTALKDIVNSQAFVVISKEMQSSIVDHVAGASGGGSFTSYDIIKIERVTNNCMWTKFRKAESKLAKSNSGKKYNVNERMLFHGSPAVEQIIQKGFDLSYSNQSGMFGAAIYFAEHSSKSNQYAYGYMGGTGCPQHNNRNCYTCVRKMLLCRVALGFMLKLKQSQRFTSLPAPHHSVSGEASTNGLRYPEYGIFDPDQAYPEFVITYKIVA